MRNNQRLQRLGVHALTTMLSKGSAKGNQQRPEHSGSLYEGQESEEFEHEEEVSMPSQVSKAAPKKMNLDSTTIGTGQRSSKRVVAPYMQEQPTRVTRQRTRILPTTDGDFHGLIPPPQELHNPNVPTTTHDDLITTTTPTHQDQIGISDEGALTISTQEVQRGVSMGKGLERISRGLCTKIAIHISEGKRRPEAGMQAAKLASEGGIILRQHIPILPHWKLYKKNESHLTNYMGKVAGHFTIDTKNKDVVHACTDLLKGGQRQMRYRLKKKYFNGVPANQVRTTSPVSCMTDAQWRDLVQIWSNSKHKDTCMKNQLNRGLVRYQQRIGSRCYIAQAHVMKQDKFKDSNPTAIDLFKEMHCSSRIGFAEPVKNAIAEMEEIIADSVVDEQQLKSSTEAVSQVLSSSTFLCNVGLLSASNRTSKGGISAQVEDLQSKLDTEKQEKEQLRHQLDAQQQELETLKTQAQESEQRMQESEQRMAKQDEEMATLKKTSQETHAFLRQLIGINQGQVNHTV